MIPTPPKKTNHSLHSLHEWSLKIGHHTSNTPYLQNWRLRLRMASAAPPTTTRRRKRLRASILSFDHVIGLLRPCPSAIQTKSNTLQSGHRARESMSNSIFNFAWHPWKFHAINLFLLVLHNISNISNISADKGFQPFMSWSSLI